MPQPRLRTDAAITAQDTSKVWSELHCSVSRFNSPEQARAFAADFPDTTALEDGQQYIVAFKDDVAALRTIGFKPIAKAAAKTEAGEEYDPTKDVVRMTMDQWKATHKDFKGIIDGQRTVLHQVPGKGTCLTPVEIIGSKGKTEAEGDNTYVAVYDGRRIEVQAPTLHAAKLAALQSFGVPPGRHGLLSVTLAKSSDAQATPATAVTKAESHPKVLEYAVRKAMRTFQSEFKYELGYYRGDSLNIIPELDPDERHGNPELENDEERLIKHLAQNNVRAEIDYESMVIVPLDVTDDLDESTVRMTRAQWLATPAADRAVIEGQRYVMRADPDVGERALRPVRMIEGDDIKKGAFHKWLGKSPDSPITAADINRGLASRDPHVNKMAQFAKNMRHKGEAFPSAPYSNGGASPGDVQTFDYKGHRFELWVEHDPDASVSDYEDGMFDPDTEFLGFILREIDKHGDPIGAEDSLWAIEAGADANFYNQTAHEMADNLLSNNPQGELPIQNEAAKPEWYSVSDTGRVIRSFGDDEEAALATLDRFKNYPGPQRVYNVVYGVPDKNGYVQSRSKGEAATNPRGFSCAIYAIDPEALDEFLSWLIDQGYSDAEFKDVGDEQYKVTVTLPDDAAIDRAEQEMEKLGLGGGFTDVDDRRAPPIRSEADTTGRAPYLSTQGSRQLDMQVPLQPGEQHCPYCGGYGGHPINRRDTSQTVVDPPRCVHCDGSGKIKGEARGGYDDIDAAYELRDLLGRDFHSLPATDVDRITAAADQAKYRAPASASGSRARYYHTKLSRQYGPKIAADFATDQPMGEDVTGSCPAWMTDEQMATLTQLGIEYPNDPGQVYVAFCDVYDGVANDSDKTDDLMIYLTGPYPPGGDSMGEAKARLVAGKSLTPAQRDEVKRAFVHRFTGEHKPDWANRPMPNGQPYKPTHATDDEWVDDHAFYMTRGGRIAYKPRYAEPAFLAGQEPVDEAANRRLMATVTGRDGRSAKIYDDRDTDEYVVCLYQNGQPVPDSDYFADFHRGDRAGAREAYADAYSTACNMVGIESGTSVVGEAGLHDVPQFKSTAKHGDDTDWEMDGKYFIAMIDGDRLVVSMYDSMDDVLAPDIEPLGQTSEPLDDQVRINRQAAEIARRLLTRNSDGGLGEAIMVTCPHCEGDGEEPGAPIDPDGIAVCDLCGGSGGVTAAKADQYRLDNDLDESAPAPASPSTSPGWYQVMGGRAVGSPFNSYQDAESGRADPAAVIQYGTVNPDGTLTAAAQPTTA